MYAFAQIEQPPEHPIGFCQCCDPEKLFLVRVWMREGFECCYECAHELKVLPARLIGVHAHYGHDYYAVPTPTDEEMDAHDRYMERGQ
jgi:hypothetical protein